MKHLRFIFSLLLIAAAFKAPGEIRWLETDYDFGLMKEVAGEKTGSARFVNIGPGPTYIRNVRTTCGCTRAEFPEGIIEEGDTVRVSFTYNPEGRPGSFAKHVKVFVGEDNKMYLIKIHGVVLGTPETLAASYPYEIGSLRFSNQVIPGGDVTYGEMKHYFISLTNQSADTIHPSLTSEEKSLNISMSPTVIPPGELATAAISFNSRGVTELGALELPMTLVSDSEGRFPEQTEVVLKVNLLPDLQALGGISLEEAPSIAVEPAVLNVGKVKKGKNLNVAFTISNNGISLLNIKRITSPGHIINVKRFPMRLEKGQKGKAELEIPLSELTEGVFRFPIEIVSNDPLHPIIEVRVTGEKE